MTNATLLVADSDAFQQQLIDMLLAVDHYTLVPVKTGLEALAYLKDNTPDLAILASNLPDMKGTDLCARMKGIRRLRHVPVIVISADMQHHATKEIAAAVKVDLVLAKPLGDKGLRGHVSDLLEKARALAMPELPEASDTAVSASLEDAGRLSGAEEGIGEADLLAEIHQPRHQLTIEHDMHVVGLGEAYLPQGLPRHSQKIKSQETHSQETMRIRPVDAFASHSDDMPETGDALVNADVSPKTELDKTSRRQEFVSDGGKDVPEASTLHEAETAETPEVTGAPAPLTLSLDISADELVGRSTESEVELDLKASAEALMAKPLTDPVSHELPDNAPAPEDREPVLITDEGISRHTDPPQAAAAGVLEDDAADVDTQDQAEMASGLAEAVPFATDHRPESHAAELELLRNQVDDLLNENEQLKAALEELESGKPMMATFSYLDAIEELETLRRLTEHQANQLTRLHQENRQLRAESEARNGGQKMGIWERLKL